MACARIPLALVSNIGLSRSSSERMWPTPTAGACTQRSVSSDGTRLVAVREDRGRRDLVTLSVLPDGRLGDERTILSGADTQFAVPRWSPDGLSIVAERRTPRVATEIVIVDAADGQVRYRARGATRAVTPAWRPDGHAVIFAADAPDGPFNLFELTLSQSRPSLRQLTWLIGGATWLVWGFFLSTVMCWHATFVINSLTHMFGRRRYVTKDDSRNSFLLALITMGEGWHNNHHYYQSSTRQGFFWWEIDLTYYVLRVLALFGIVWDLREPPAHVVAGHLRNAA